MIINSAPFILIDIYRARENYPTNRGLANDNSVATLSGKIIYGPSMVQTMDHESSIFSSFNGPNGWITAYSIVNCKRPDSSYCDDDFIFRLWNIECLRLSLFADL